MAAYIYARVSTLTQATEGLSLDGQIHSCRQYCSRNGFDLGAVSNCGAPGIIVDGGTSAFKNSLNARKAGLLLLGCLRPGDRVVVTSINRLFRRMRDAVTVMEDWTNRGIEVHFTDYPGLTFNSANGRLLLHCLSAVAQFRSELIAIRVKEGRARKAMQTLSEQATVSPSASTAVSAPLSPVFGGTATIRAMLDIHQIRPQETKVKRVFGYARVSTDSQSVDSQVHAIQQRFPDATVYSDLAVSAFTTPLNKRPAGKALLSQVQAGDMIVAVRPDRLFRSLQDAANQIAEVHRRGAFLMFLDSGSRSDTILGKLLLQVLCMFAELESAETGRSLRHARLAMIASGSDSLDSLLPQPLQQKTSKDKRHACMWRFVPPPDRRGIFNTLLVEMRKGIPFLQASRFAANLWLSQNGLPVIPRRNRVTRKAYLAALKKSPQTLLVKRVIKYLENSPAECVQPPGPSGDICRQNAEKFLRAYHTYKNPEDALIAAIAPDMASAVEAVSNLTN